MEIVECFYRHNPKADLELALEMAAATGSLPCLKFLIEKGALIQEVDLIEAASGGHLDVVEYILEKCRLPLIVSLQNAVEKRKFDVVKYLVEYGATISEKAVLLSIYNDDLHMLHYLIEHGGEIQRPSLAIDIMCHSSPSVASYILKLGLNVIKLRDTITEEVFPTLSDAIRYRRLNSDELYNEI